MSFEEVEMRFERRSAAIEADSAVIEAAHLSFVRLTMFVERFPPVIDSCSDVIEAV